MSIHRTNLCLTIVSALAMEVALGSAARAAEADRPRYKNDLIDRSERGNPKARRWTVQQRLDVYKVPGVAVAVIKNGRVVITEGFGTKLAGTREPIDGDTVFSVGSVSKMANAALILRLVDAGRLDLDRDVNAYLKRWKVAESDYTKKQKVTLRAILSHTAGFNVHGFADFSPNEKLPTLLQTLNGQSPAKHEPIAVIQTPGTQMRYSGGGTTVSQLIVEEVTGMAYPVAAKAFVFDPLKMTRSTFVNPLPASHGNIARAHDDQGRPTALPRGWESMPELAASGLWTSVNDLAKLVTALSGRTKFLSSTVRQDMLTRVPNSWHGLGPRLNGEGVSRVFHHGGSNDSYKAWIEGHPATGDGVIILTNGARGAFVRSELRDALDREMSWAVKYPDHFKSPFP